jgi:hypothetical protein
MTDVVETIAIVAGFLIAIEIWRWHQRPEQRRLRMIRKIDGRR